MVYRILTNLGKGGSPFQYTNTSPTAPGDPLRVSPQATLVAFENQHDSVLARQIALAYGKMFWHVTEDILHPDDLPAAEVFSSGREFKRWLFESDRNEQVL